MARRRMLDPSFWDDESVGLLPVQSRLLFLCAVSHADDHGKLHYSPAWFKKVCFGYCDYSISQVQAWLEEIISAVPNFHLYEVDGQQYVRLEKWCKYQRVDKPSPSTIPDPCSTTGKSKNTPRMLQEESKNTPRVELHEGRKETTRKETNKQPPTPTQSANSNGEGSCPEGKGVVVSQNPVEGREGNGKREPDFAAMAKQIIPEDKPPPEPSPPNPIKTIGELAERMRM